LVEVAPRVRVTALGTRDDLVILTTPHGRHQDDEETRRRDRVGAAGTPIDHDIGIFV